MRAVASRTAVLTCQGRAVAHGRMAVGRFHDPVAVDLLRGKERTVVEQVRDAAVPNGGAARLQYEFMRGCALRMVPRTIAIDDAVRDGPREQLVILGAGLDTRAWRMPELAETTVFEVDHPASQADKRDRLGDREGTAAEVRYTPTDFTRDELADTLSGTGHRRHIATTWVWEGVVPYLTRAQVAANIRVLGTLAASGSRLIINYQTPSITTRIGRAVGSAMLRLAGGDDAFRDEPHRSFWMPTQLAAVLGEHGFAVIGDRDLRAIWEDSWSTAVADGAPRSLPHGHVMLSERR